MKSRRLGFLLRGGAGRFFVLKGLNEGLDGRPETTWVPCGEELSGFPVKRTFFLGESKEKGAGRPICPL
jgi:hypothetical protein